MADTRAPKVQALIDHGATVGEQQAAASALVRVDAKLPAVPPKDGPLSDAMVRRLALPEKGNHITWDTALSGFGIRVTAGGCKSYVYDYYVRGSGRRRRFTIGQFPTWTSGAARIKARELRRRVDNEEDPLGDIKEARAAETVDDLADRFVEEHLLPKRRQSTISAYQSILKKYIRPHFRHLKVRDVAFEHIDALHRHVTKIGGPYTANRCIAVCSKMFNLAIRWNMRTDNPVRGIERNAEIERKRYLDSDELARLVKALAEYPDQQSANVIRLLMFTGARKSEILAMRWADADLNTGIWTKLGSTTKQKTDHIVPLSAPALQLLKDIQKQQTAKRHTLGQWVFPANSKTGHAIDPRYGWNALCRAAGITNIRIHDLRHSFASLLGSGGASLPLIGAILGHSNPKTTARYVHLFQNPQRAAVDQVGAIITAAGKPKKKKR
jgi:integrase